jgi:hypothetical protein
VPEPAHLKRFNRTLESVRSITDPMQRLDAVRQIREALDELEVAAARDARAADATWAEIGSLYGLTKQGAQQRFRRKKDAPDGSVNGQ